MHGKQWSDGNADGDLHRPLRVHGELLYGNLSRGPDIARHMLGEGHRRKYRELQFERHRD
jgi:hypothetical protein